MIQDLKPYPGRKKPDVQWLWHVPEDLMIPTHYAKRDN